MERYETLIVIVYININLNIHVYNVSTQKNFQLQFNKKQFIKS